MRKIYLLFGFLLISFHLTGDQFLVDSLRVKLENTRGKERIDILNTLAFHHHYLSPDKGIELGRQALQMADSLNYALGRAQAWQNISVNLIIKGENAEALRYQKNALQLFEEIDNTMGVTNCYLNLGLIYSDLGDFERSLGYYFKARDLQKAHGDSLGMGKSLLNSGLIYLELGQSDKAQEYFQQTIEIAQEIGNEPLLGLAYNNMGVLLMETDQTKALNYFNRALDIKQKSGDQIALANLNINMGIIHQEQKNWKQAIAHFQRSKTLATRLKDKKTLVLSLINLASVERQIDHPDVAIHYLEDAISLGEPLGILRNLDLAHYALSEIYREKKQFKQAYHHLSRACFYRDSLYTQESVRQIADMQTKYDTQAKEKENEILRKEQLINQAIIRRRGIVILAVSLITLLCILIIYLIIKDNRIKIEKNRLLEESNAQIQQQKRDLEKANHSKDLFFSIIAHDLRTPFVTMMSFIRLMTKNIDNYSRDKLLELIEDLKSNTVQALGLLENLLEWSRTQTGRLEYKPEPIRVENLLRTSLREVEQMAHIKKLDVSIHTDQQLKITADHHMITSVIRNLLTNAIKFTPEGGRITASTDRKNGFVEITIEDSGVGINKEKLTQLFQIDNKLSTRGTAGERGSGLGLILCKEFIERHQGRIEVNSIPGQGSRFTVTLPAAEN